MRVLAINGSPRKNGNTASLVNKVLEGVMSAGGDTRRIDLADERIRFVSEEDYTISFDAARSDSSDDLGLLIDEMEAADVIILASPVFFGSITGQMKAMIDRFQFAWLEKNLNGRNVFAERKKGVFVSVQAQDRHDFFDNSSSIIKHFFATVNISYDAELLLGHLEKKGDAVSMEGYLDKAFQLGQGLVG